MLFEEKKGYYSLSYLFDEKEYKFSGTLRETLGGAINFLVDNKFDFEDSFFTKPVTHDEIISNPSYKNYLRSFFKLKNGLYFYIGGNLEPALRKVINMLVKFGIPRSDIKTEGFNQTTKIKKFGEVDNVENNIEEIDDIEEIDNEFIDKIKTYSKNPFRQSICVLGESGAGKSTTIRHILEFEGHEFDQIIPSASTTGLLSQFSPSRSGYIQSRLGKLIVKAFNDPTTLYTAIFDECHKSNIIEMINDELLQAISTKRNMGRRFISLDDDTSELYKGVDFDRGNILIPDNFGFIFISSKPRIISNNTDFFNRVDLVVLTESDREMKTSDELLSKVLPEEEKMKLASTRND